MLLAEVLIICVLPKKLTDRFKVWEQQAAKKKRKSPGKFPLMNEVMGQSLVNRSTVHCLMS